MVPESLGAERDFGDLLIRRGAGTPQWIYAGLLLGLSALCIWVAVAGAKKGGQIEWSAVGCSSVFGLLGWITFQLARVKTEFYRHGVIQRRGRRVLRFMAYSDCDRFSFVATRDFWHGQYVFTIVELRMESASHTSVRWFGRYKETRELTVAISGQHFEVVDQFEALKHVVTEQMVHRWMVMRESGRSVIWKQLELAPQGITPHREFENGRCVPYDHVEIRSARSGLLEFRPRGMRYSIWANGLSRPLAVARTSEPNFWVFLAWLQRMGGNTLVLDEQDQRSSR